MLAHSREKFNFALICRDAKVPTLQTCSECRCSGRPRDKAGMRDAGRSAYDVPMPLTINDVVKSAISIRPPMIAYPAFEPCVSHQC